MTLKKKFDLDGYFGTVNWFQDPALSPVRPTVHLGPEFSLPRPSSPLPHCHARLPHRPTGVLHAPADNQRCYCGLIGDTTVSYSVMGGTHALNQQASGREGDGTRDCDGDSDSLARGA